MKRSTDRILMTYDHRAGAQDQRGIHLLRSGQSAPRPRVGSLKEVKLPDGKALSPGVIDTLTNHVEHPRLVAQRLENLPASSARKP